MTYTMQNILRISCIPLPIFSGLIIRKFNTATEQSSKQTQFRSHHSLFP